MMLATLQIRARQRQQSLSIAQSKKLRYIVKKANQHPYYYRLFQTCRIQPNACTMEDLRRLPILTKETLRERCLENRFSDKKNIRFWRTTGSSGLPLTIPMSEHEDALTNVFIRYALLKSGLRLTDALCFIFVGSDKLTDNTLFQKMGFGRQYTLNLNNDIRSNIDLLNRIRPDAVCSYPSYLSVLAKFIQNERLSLPSVQRIITHGEVLTSATRRLLQSAFGARIYDSYGSVEFGRLAYECESGSLHVIPDAVIIEVINADRDGVGDAIITSLYHETMPLIRYCIRDRIKLSDLACRCGVQSQIIERIEGRCDDFLILPSGQRISARSINVLEDIPGILEFQTIQKSPERFEVHIRKSDLFNSASAELVRQRIQQGCLDENVHITIKFAHSIKRARTGKLRAVVSEVRSREREIS